MWLELKQKGRSACFLGVYYRKPDTGIDELNELEENFENVLALSSNIIVMGDFNVNMHADSKQPHSYASVTLTLHTKKYWCNFTQKNNFVATIVTHIVE